VTHDAARQPGGVTTRPDLATTVIATITAAVLCGLYLIAPHMGGDLSAQIARADFARAHATAVIDFRWFGGTLPFGYSLWTPAVMAVVGVRITGAIATVVTVGFFTAALHRVGARHPRWGGLAAAVTLTSNLVEGRVTFACSLAFALAAVWLLAGAAPHRLIAAGLCVLGGAASPVGALFLLVGAGALLLMKRWRDALALAASFLPVLVISVVFGDGGRQIFSGNDAIRAAVATALVIALVPKRFRLLQVGAAIGLVMVIAAVVVPTPVGSNSARLSLLFAVPVVAAFVDLRRWLAAGVILLVIVVQTPITFGTLTGAGRAVTSSSYFAPLAAELEVRGALTGRVEVPELTGHWDAAYLAQFVPLARGWLRQTDIKLNNVVFYQHLPTAASYRSFLDRSAVQYVAVADARPTFTGRRELTLIKTRLPYLRQVWSSSHWRLYEVLDPMPIVSAPASLVSYHPARIVVQAPADTDVTVRVRWFRWLTLDPAPAGSCLQRLNAQTVRLHTAAAGQYVITSAPLSQSRRC
jgi:hypothetical protein